MNTLLGYIESDGTYKVLTSTEEIYSSQLLSFEHNCPFTEGTELDDDEWFKIELFNKKDYCLPILLEDIASTQYNQLQESKYSDLDYLVAVQDSGNTFCFQRITSQSILKRKVLSLSQAPAIHKMEKTILLEDIPHAIYKKDENCLYFKRLSTLTPIFKGIDSLYREATHDEATAFMSSSFMDTAGQIDIGKISSANLKRIHAASEKLSSLTDKQREKILNYIHKYKSDIPYDATTNKYTITSNTELQFLLWGIEERYFSTITKKERRVARSVMRLN